MRLCLLLGVAAAPVAFAADARRSAMEVQVPIVAHQQDNSALPTYPQWPAGNSTAAIATVTSVPAAKSNATAQTSSTPPPDAAAGADLPSPALDRSIFSLVIFGIAGLCLL